MRRIVLTLAAVSVFVLASTLGGGCSCSVSGGEGTKAIDVSMGGHVIKDDRLDFKAVSCQGTQLVIQNRATQQPLTIGPGTPILSGDGTTVVARVIYGVTMAPRQQGLLTLTGPLQIAATYYLGSPPAGGKPSIRQLFVCPGAGAAAPGGAPYIPTVPTGQTDLPTE